MNDTSSPLDFLTFWPAGAPLPALVFDQDEGRVVRDGNILTGGGVTAGIALAFTMVSEIAGEGCAKALTLGLEYPPSLLLSGGRLDLANRQPGVA